MAVRLFINWYAIAPLVKEYIHIYDEYHDFDTIEECHDAKEQFLEIINDKIKDFKEGKENILCLFDKDINVIAITPDISNFLHYKVYMSEELIDDERQ